ncbi:MAG: 2-5 ligase [Thermoleophilia bacterium]|nr:2-5 ligase [Thermoleophilia bacterium]MCZ4496615.1 2-5 ligase [Thermoleophilia bacterium]
MWNLDAGELKRASGGGVGLRLFVAMPVPTAAASMLADYADLLVDRVPTTRPVLPTDMHLTFAYLGEVSEDLLPVVASLVDDAAQDIGGATSCSTTGIGVKGRASAAVSIDTDLLVLLAAARDRLLNAAAPLAPHRDLRAWQPHVTIARGARATDLPEPLSGVIGEPPAVTWIASELVLHASLPGMSERQHRVLHVASCGEIHAS